MRRLERFLSDSSRLDAVACLARKAAPRLHSLAALTKASLTDDSSEVRLAAAELFSGLADQARRGEFDARFPAAGRSFDLFEKVLLLAQIHDPSDEVSEFARSRIVEVDDEVVMHQAVDALEILGRTGLALWIETVRRTSNDSGTTSFEAVLADVEDDRQTEFAVRLYDASLDYEERQSLIAKATSARRPKLHSLAAVLRAALFDASADRWDRSDETPVRRSAAERLLEVARLPENSTIPKRSGASCFYLRLLEKVLLLALLYDGEPQVQHEAAWQVLFRADRNVQIEALSILERVGIQDSEDWPTLIRKALNSRSGTSDEW
ncbi:hypothetical protein FIV42_07490 [Persicimonas caeni]|uniref:Uncharacterized protein n=1 Tax=Persicimonas caeni TaxID=2292766 RepID=A0A4Y6PQG3_PERCE|nr:hypothetical protein [Persicimonas caeni]QDG50582.1 hypothetical protein FIV42_07490 [Persicimonas caeni]QED31803.1 hypothetical protein FRD00_07485 [Persicimonas caeni]